MSKNKLMDLQIISNDYKIFNFFNVKLYFNLDQEKYFIELKPFSISNQKINLIKVVKNKKEFYFFANNAIIFSLENKVFIKMSEKLFFYKSDKKNYLIQKSKNKNNFNFFNSLKSHVNFNFDPSFSNYQEIQAQSNNLIKQRLKDLLYLFETEVENE